MYYKINRLEKRPSSELVKELAHYGTALIADTMGRYGAMLPYIKPISSKVSLAGPAVTVQTYRSDNLMLHVGLELAEAGDVLVADAGGVENAGLWGDLMTTMAVCKGVSGLVIDGAVRDKADIQEKGFPVFSREVSPLGGFKNNPGSVNVPVCCGGVTVSPGDIIIGDADGVMVVPFSMAEQVAKDCKKTQEKEDNFRKRMLQGEHLFELLKLHAELERLGLQFPE